ncbi:aspartate aminotransferase/aminotransferase [Amycolatopsis xylanica]|uniref:Aminotransferase n=1 Tax=Amycolatopsis xylanica TaxID=589385 RepID=A0A1H3PLW1_9PSEU|nr:pyridoxal phosphate-dependent aminotransferase [Amycolatopsis xylanica]SDZ01941.1 aspartate aminotransferase/aminotransferase [Amycolatopsis xylanica]
MANPLRPSSLLESVDQALSIKYNNLVYDLKSTGHDIITLSLGESFFDVPAPDFDGIEPDELHHYSHSRGLPELRRQLAKYYGNQFGLSVDPDHEILITAGSKVAIYLALLATVEPGDEVLVLEPFWLSYPTQVRLCGGVPVSVPHDVSVFGLGAYITGRTRAIIVNNPNNPSGHVYTAAELDHLHELADEHGLLLMVDEAYNEFVAPGTGFITCGAADPELRHTVTLNSMSKNYGISGWRVGYVIAHRTLIDQILKVNQHLITCAPTPLMRYLADHFDTLIEHTRPQIQQVVARRNEVADWLAERGIEVLPGESTFYLFASLGRSKLGSDAFADRLLRESGVCVVPGIAYGESCDHHIRVSVGTESPERIRRGLDAIARLIESTG